MNSVAKGYEREIRQCMAKGRGSSEKTHIWSFVDVFGCEDIPENVDGGIWFDSDAGLHTQVMDIACQFPWVCFAGCFGVGGGFGGGRGDSSFVVEAVEIAAGLFEILDPFLRLGGKIEAREMELVG